MTVENLNLIANELFRESALVYKPRGTGTNKNVRVISELDSGVDGHESVIHAKRKEQVQNLNNPDVSSGFWIRVKYRQGDPRRTDSYTVELRDEDTSTTVKKEEIPVRNGKHSEHKREEVARVAKRYLNTTPVAQ